MMEEHDDKCEHDFSVKEESLGVPGEYGTYCSKCGILEPSEHDELCMCIICIPTPKDVDPYASDTEETESEPIFVKGYDSYWTSLNNGSDQASQGS